MESCDIVDKSGVRTGRIVERGTILNPDEFYLVVHIWIRDENNNYLIQQRALHLGSAPGMWCTTAGFVVSGEKSIDGAVREVNEELGIHLSPTDLHRIDRHVMDNRVEDIWMAEISRETEKDIELGDEVENYKWVSRDELERLVNEGNVFRYSYHGRLF